MIYLVKLLYDVVFGQVSLQLDYFIEYLQSLALGTEQLCPPKLR